MAHYAPQLMQAICLRGISRCGRRHRQLSNYLKVPFLRTLRKATFT